MINSSVGDVAGDLLFVAARKQLLQLEVEIKFIHNVGAELLLKKYLSTGFGWLVELELGLLVEDRCKISIVAGLPGILQELLHCVIILRK